MVETLAPSGLRRQAQDDRGRVRDVRRRRARRRRHHVRRPRAARRAARRATRRSSPPRSRSRRRSARQEARGSCRRSAARCPESWRRVMPVPLAAGLYGVLLGLGFTTFILSFAVWALAGISVALGDPQHRPADRARVRRRAGAPGDRARPVRRRRPARRDGRAPADPARRSGALDALALAVTAAALAVDARPGRRHGHRGRLLGPQRRRPRPRAAPPRGIGELRSPAGIQPLPGQPPGGRRRAAWPGSRARRSWCQNVAAIPAPGADARRGLDELGRLARRRGAVRGAARSRPGLRRRDHVIAGAVGKPSLAATCCVYELAGQIEAYRPRDRPARPVLRRETRAELRGPSVVGYRLTYVRATYQRQQVMTGLLVPRRVSSDRTLYGTTPTARRDAGHEQGRFPRQGPHQQAAVGAPAGGRARHADHDRQRRTPPST